MLTITQTDLLIMNGIGIFCLVMFNLFVYILDNSNVPREGFLIIPLILFGLFGMFLAGGIFTGLLLVAYGHYLNKKLPQGLGEINFGLGLVHIILSVLNMPTFIVR